MERSYREDVRGLLQKDSATLGEYACRFLYYVVVRSMDPFDEATVKEYRVTKYNPALRGPNGEYKGHDWSMYSQIGQTFEGVVLTEQEYRRVENAYVKVALAFLSESGIAALRAIGLENSREQPLEFVEGSILPVEELPPVFGRILRAEFWCRFQADEGFVHFGWDYYMYVGVPHRCPAAEQTASALGLHVEEFTSPYRDETEGRSGRTP